ncbi:efflux RND transporter periplasmic adaptor subunit [Sphingoaurantiacus capsulatus]|uniref:Efflux RND transporter periplasmic adaptor subunit n=1 Tax=Sphingoaurantiacus capsulatus TaxID=1771310 RepID=A0ABV7X9A0_9SPHN
MDIRDGAQAHRLKIMGAVLLAGGALAYWTLGGEPEGEAADDDIAPVRVAIVERAPFDVELKALGTVTPLATVAVRSRVDGAITRLHFREGQQVGRGQLLAEIDPRPFQASLAQAVGERQQNQAQLRQAQSQLGRHRELAGKGFTTKAQLEQHEALVGQHGGAVATSNGRIADARLQLEFSRIRAPISGRIGFRGVDAGNLISAGDAAPIATITQVQPISVVFTVPETQVDAVRAAMGAGALRVEAWDRGEQAVLATGRLTNMDNQIDAGSGTLRLRGEFANGDARLFPNQFVNVRLGLQTFADAITVPAVAVQQGTAGPFVYVVDKDGVARRRVVTLGPTDGERTMIRRGVTPAERVVIEGFDSVKDAEKVEIIGTPAAAAGAASAADK